MRMILKIATMVFRKCLHQAVDQLLAAFLNIAIIIKYIGLKELACVSRLNERRMITFKCVQICSNCRLLSFTFITKESIEALSPSVQSFILTMTNAQSIPKDTKRYLQYCNTDLEHCLLQFCMSSHATKAEDVLLSYRAKSEVEIPISTFYAKFKKEVTINNDKKLSLKDIQSNVRKIYVNKNMTLPEEDLEFANCKSIAEKIIKQLFDTKRNNQRKQRNDLHQSNCILTAEEELYVTQLCTILANCGHGLDVDEVRVCMNIIAPLPDGMPHSETASRNFIKRHPELKLSGSSGIDPQRASQATDAVRETYFCKLDSYIDVLYNLGKIKWKSFADIPPRLIYNMDEVGSDTTKRRNKVVKEADATIRVFTITPEGDKMPFHVTTCVTSRSDGQYQSPIDGVTEGAPPPVIIHSKKVSSDDVKPETVPDRLLRGVAPMGNTGEYKDATDAYKRNNVYGFLVLATPNGSMKQCTMLPYAEHFVASLPKNRDPLEAVILLLDGHSSRWDLPALLYLLQHGVYPFYLPSHTSIWSQANDVGPNMRLHKCISEAAKKRRRGIRGRAFTPSDWNVVFREAWADFLSRERSDFRQMKSNSATYAFGKTGIYPFNPRSSSWIDAIDTLGSSAQGQNLKFWRSYEIRPASDESVSLCESEKEDLLRDFISIDTMDSDAAKMMRAANKQGKSILARWRDRFEMKRKELIDTIDSDSASSATQEGWSSSQKRMYQDLLKLHPNDFVVTPKDKAAMKVILFVLCDADSLAKPAELSKEEHRKNYIRTVLAQTCLAESVKVQKIGTIEEDLKGVISTCTATKTGQDEWQLAEPYLDKESGTRKVRLTTIPTNDLMEKECYNVVGDALSDKATEKQKRQQKASINRRRKHESRRKQEVAVAKAKERRNDMLREEYQKMVRAFSAGGTYTFDQFMVLENKLTDPFVCDIDVEGETMRAYANHHESGAFNLVLHQTITSELFSEKRSSTGSGNEDGNARKRQKTSSGRRQVPTRNSEDGISATEYLEDFDRAKGIECTKDAIKKLSRAKDSLASFHKSIVKYKQKKPSEYFKVPDGNVKSHVTLLYRLFDGPAYTTKGLGEMKAYLDKQVVLQETTDARISKIEQRIVEIETQLQDLTASVETNKVNEEEESAGDNEDEDSVREEEIEAMEEDEIDDVTSQHPDGESA